MRHNNLSTARRYQVFGVIIICVVTVYIFSGMMSFVHTPSGDEKSSTKSYKVATKELMISQQRQLLYKGKTDAEKSFGEEGINSILLDEVKLKEFDPFSIDSKINVWDLYPPTISCPDVSRVGKVGDGGKWMCGLKWLIERPRNQKCVVYSFGISTDASFEEELSIETNCEIHAFDPTIGKLPPMKVLDAASYLSDGKSRIRFHKIALGLESGSNKVNCCE